MDEKEALLNQLRDVEVPDVTGTLAPGWWLLMLLFISLLLVAYFLHRRGRTRLWQRQARSELQLIREASNSEPSISILSRCSQLARKIVLAVDARDQVAALHGEAWLEKLDDICARPEFTQGIGRLLLDQPYQKAPVVAAQDFSALFESMTVLIDSAVGYKPTVKPVGQNKRPES